jgi:cell division protein FtsI/penicillin-binding protein 2
MSFKNRYSSGWIDIQERLRRDSRRKSLLGKLPLFFLYFAFTSLFLGIVFYSITLLSGYQSFFYQGHSDAGQPSVLPAKMLGQDISMVFKALNLGPADLKDRFIFEKDGVRYIIHSSIDPALQDYVLGLLRRSNTLQAAVVVLRPNDGRVLAMASFENSGSGENLCLKADYPAASLFKIVSAAAAMESAGFTPNQPLFFRGYKHTLYKRQLEEKTGRYFSKTSLRSAFASSINSIFGKLGMHYLGKGVLSEYADRFLFNRVIPFDLPVAMSTAPVPDDDFGLAEISSGFNKKTLISPLHAALLAMAVANNGIIMAPRLVESVLSDSGEILFKSKPTMLTAALSRGTAEDLKVLMRDTILHGTCRKAFLPLRRKKALKDVDFGAKTGTINDSEDRFKYDWLTAYALPPNGAKAICVAVLSVHGKTLGIRANELGQNIVNYYLTS